MMRRAYSLIFAAVLVFLTGTAVFFQAECYDGQESEITDINEGERIEKDLFIATRSLVNRGEVDGEIFCASNSFYNFGKVEGDIISFSSYSRVDGTAGADVRVASERVEISGIVGEDATVMARTADITGDIGNTLFIAAQRASVSGRIGRDFRGIAQTIVIDGVIEGDVSIEAESVNLGPNARIKGDFIYRSDRDATIPTGAVEGIVERRDPIFDSKEGIDRFEKESRKYSVGARILFGLGYLVVALVFYAFFKPFIERESDNIREIPWRSAGVGFMALVVIPVASVILLVTIIGMPLSVLSLAGYSTLIYLAKIPVAHMVGKLIFKGKGSYLSLIVGVASITILSSIPYAGKFISLAAILLGMGGFFITSFGKSNFKKEKIVIEENKGEDRGSS